MPTLGQHMPRHAAFSWKASLLVATIAVLATTSSAVAQQPGSGEPAPNFSERARFVWETPNQEVNVDDFIGEVVVIAAFGTASAPCILQVNRYKELQELYQDEGMNMFQFEMMGLGADELRVWCAERQINYPVAANGPRAIGDYDVESTVPKVWVIDVEGVIQYAGKPHDHSPFERVLERELERVQYIGLGIVELQRPLRRAGGYWQARRFERARDAARGVIDHLPADAEHDSEEDAEVRSQAQHIIDRAGTIAEQMLALAEQHVEDERYVVALQLFDKVATEFANADEADQAVARREEIRGDNEIRPILDAQARVQRVWERIDMSNPASRTSALNTLRVLQRRYAENAAGELAQEYIDLLELGGN